MGIGASVFLLAVGAIMAFAVDDRVNGVNITAVGLIIMAAGAVGLFMTTLVFGRRDRYVGAATVVDPYVTDAPVVERTVERPVVERRVVTEAPVVERRIRY